MSPLSPTPVSAPAPPPTTYGAASYGPPPVSYGAATYGFVAYPSPVPTTY